MVGSITSNYSIELIIVKTILTIVLKLFNGSHYFVWDLEVGPTQPPEAYVRGRSKKVKRLPSMAKKRRGFWDTGSTLPLRNVKQFKEHILQA